MKGKLIKTVDGYELFTQGFLKGSTNHGLIESLNIEEGPIRYKLSLKNCQAIERGYDLDELAEEWIDANSHKWSNNNNEVGDNYGSFKSGFQKALEILGDKKFSEQDVRDAYFHGEKDSYTKGGQTKEMENEFIQSLQQTQWDVEIVMVPAMSNNGNVYYGDISKLDSEGCLTLKRI